MKTTDVPQDDANMLQGKFKEPVYSIDADGNFKTIPSVGWDPKNEVMKEAWDVVHNKIEIAKQQVISGEKSPIAYYIEKNIMDIGLVAKYMGIWRLTVKRHLKPNNFKKLKTSTLNKYAEVFNITVEQLVNIELDDK